MKTTARRFLALASALAAAWLFSGCLALPVGGFRDITGSWTEEKDGPFQAETAEVAVRAVAVGNDSLSAGMALNLSGKVPRERLLYSLTVEKGKWCSVGLFPAVAEEVYAPAGALTPSSPFTDAHCGGCLFFPVVSPLEILFGPWECSSHRWYGTNAHCLVRLDPGTRQKIGAMVPDDKEYPDYSDHGWTHASIAGFHKFCSYVVHDPVLKQREPLPERQTDRSEGVGGPYSVAVDIPELGWSASGTVERGEVETAIPLPFAFPAGEYEAQIGFSVPGERLSAEKNPVVRKALKSANGQTYSVRFRIVD